MTRRPTAPPSATGHRSVRERRGRGWGWGGRCVVHGEAAVETRRPVGGSFNAGSAMKRRDSFSLPRSNFHRRETKERLVLIPRNQRASPWHPHSGSARPASAPDPGVSCEEKVAKKTSPFFSDETDGPTSWVRVAALQPGSSTQPTKRGTQPAAHACPPMGRDRSGGQAGGAGLGGARRGKRGGCARPSQLPPICRYGAPRGAGGLQNRPLQRCTPLDPSAPQVWGVCHL